MLNNFFRLSPGVLRKHQDSIDMLGGDTVLELSFHDHEESGDLAACKGSFKFTDGAGKVKAMGK